MKVKEKVMDLIERYVHAVGRQLPRKNRADIQAELQSTLVDMLDDRVKGEASQEDEIALLKEFGPPQKVAASYWPEGQYLIGPRLYPFFRMVVGIVLIVFVVVQLVLLGVAVVFNQMAPPNLEFLAGFVSSIFSAIGIIVLVFAVLQRLDVRPDAEEEDWDPRELPAVSEVDTISRRGLVAEITFGLILIAILLFLPDNIGIVLNPWAEVVQVVLNPELVSYIPLIILSLLLGIALDVYLLWRGRWTTLTRVAKIGTNLFSLYVLFVLIVGHNAWLAQEGAAGFFSALEALPAGVAAPIETVQIIVMQAFRLAFVVALIVIGIETINLIYKLVKRLVGSTTSSTIIPPESA
jgi:hypothetical protein